jgi:hypothetical protein
MAGVTGLEPAASGVTGRRSNQLSYTPYRAAKPRPEAMFSMYGLGFRKSRRPEAGPLTGYCGVVPLASAPWRLANRLLAAGSPCWAASVMSLVASPGLSPTP